MAKSDETGGWTFIDRDQGIVFEEIPEQKADRLTELYRSRGWAFERINPDETRGRDP